MEEQWGGKEVPFAARCPLCGKTTRGFVGSWYCLGGGGPFSEKVTGLIKDTCTVCRKIIGLRLKLVGSRTEVIDAGDFVKMQLQDWAQAIAKKRDQ